MNDIKIKAAENIPCDTETAQWDKLSDEALANMEKKMIDQEKDHTKEIECPECGIILPVENFLVMAFLKSTNKYWCPECGMEWEIKP